MPKYTITVQQVIDVEADDKELALQVVKANPPRRDMFGAGTRGAYGLNTRKSVKIISCVEKRRKKNA